MRTCAVITCKGKGAHTYPADPNLRQQWIRATRVDVQRKIGYHLSKYSCVCSNHFKPSDFVIRRTLRILNKTAVPSIFPWAPATIDNIAEPKDSKIEKPEDTITEKPLEIKFNRANAVKTYSKPVPEVPITFVEVCPSIKTEVTEREDPLEIISSEQAETLENQLTIQIEYNSEEIISVNKDDDSVTSDKYSNQNQKSFCDSSVQTDPFPEMGFQTDRCPFVYVKIKTGTEVPPGFRRVQLGAAVNSWLNLGVTHLSSSKTKCSRLKLCKSKSSRHHTSKN